MDVQNFLSWCYLSKQGHGVSPINRGGATELSKHCIRVFPRFVCGKEGEGVGSMVCSSVWSAFT